MLIIHEFMLNHKIYWKRVGLKSQKSNRTFMFQGWLW